MKLSNRWTKEKLSVKVVELESALGTRKLLSQQWFVPVKQNKS